MFYSTKCSDTAAAGMGVGTAAEALHIRAEFAPGHPPHTGAARAVASGRRVDCGVALPLEATLVRWSAEAETATV
eukprot:1196371-Prorocentrum_minimum.AAC.3